MQLDKKCDYTGFYWRIFRGKLTILNELLSEDNSLPRDISISTKEKTDTHTIIDTDEGQFQLLNLKEMPF